MTPRNLGELLAISEPAARALAAKSYIEQREEAIKEARRIRDEAVLEYSKTHSLNETAAACGVSIGTVKVIRR